MPNGAAAAIVWHHVAFFTTIGMAASVAVLRAGGAQVVTFLVLSIAFCFVQNGLGMAVARGFGEHPLLGVLAGSVTLVGGPATGLAFAPRFEEAGLPAAAVVAITAATFGIVCGGVLGGPSRRSGRTRWSWTSSGKTRRSSATWSCSRPTPPARSA